MVAMMMMRMMTTTMIMVRRHQWWRDLNSLVWFYRKCMGTSEADGHGVEPGQIEFSHRYMRWLVTDWLLCIDEAPTSPVGDVHAKCHIRPSNRSTNEFIAKFSFPTVHNVHGSRSLVRSLCYLFASCVELNYFVRYGFELFRVLTLSHSISSQNDFQWPANMQIFKNFRGKLKRN